MAGRQGQGKTGGPYPSSPDPNFPDRPDHEDFHVLSRLIQDLDRAATADTFEGLVFNDVDKDSLVYLIRQRLLRAEMLGSLAAAPRMTFMALYMEAFTMGRRFAEAKGRS